MKRLAHLGSFLVLAGLAHAAEPTQFPFKDGDQPIVFIGDSITEQRQYTTLIETYLLTRFPDWKLTFRNAGWNGDIMHLWVRGGIDNGLKRDVLPLKPAVALINFGMNDGRHGYERIPLYADAARQMIGILTNAGSRVVLLSPSPEEQYEPDQPAGSSYNTTLRAFSASLATVSDQTGIPLVNQLDPFIACIEAGRKAGVLGTRDAPRLIPDTVHPNGAGHLIMAATILKALKAPSLVSHLEIDFNKAAVTASNDCTASVEKTDDGLTFTRTDVRLPWGIPEDYRQSLAIPGFTPLDDLNRYTLAIKGLLEGSFQLLCNQTALGTWTSVELAAGVNLSTTPCPVVAQALDLHQQVLAKNNIYYARWRNVQVAQNPTTEELQKAKEAELARLDQSTAQMEAWINALRKPRPQTFVLRPAPGG